MTCIIADSFPFRKNVTVHVLFVMLHPANHKGLVRALDSKGALSTQLVKTNIFCYFIRRKSSRCDWNNGDMDRLIVKLREHKKSFVRS